MRVLVTAGPTHEPIDAVRYIGNRSSGRMGVAIATAAAEAGHAATLLLGPVPMSTTELHAVFPPSERRRLRRFRTAEDLRGLLATEGPEADLIVMAAAVADFRPEGLASEGKLERGDALVLRLAPVPDLLAEVASRARPAQRLVGFALEEPARLEERARAKLLRKGLDAIVANPLETMDAEGVAGQVFLRDGRVLHPPAWPDRIPKERFAAWLVERLAEVPAKEA